MGGWRHAKPQLANRREDINTLNHEDIGIIFRRTDRQTHRHRQTDSNSRCHGSAFLLLFIYLRIYYASISSDEASAVDGAGRTC